MDLINNTQVTIFVLSGLTDNGNLAPYLFIFLLYVYMVTVLGNIGMMAVVHNSSNLSSPMYYFLYYLSLVDLFYPSIITPKMLSDLLSKKKSISFFGCALQSFFLAAMGATEALLLSNMSYDRYVAICHPLHYVLIMTKMKCVFLVVLAFSVGFLQSLAQTSCAFSLKFCNSNLINHFYCEIPLLMRLSCSDTFLCDVVTVFIMCSCGIGSFVVIIISYTLIVSSILQMKSTKGRQKAFSTCSSHLTSVLILYGTVFFIYLRPPTSAFGKQDKVVSILYTVIIPMLNPLIYSLRNQEVKRAILEIVQRLTDAGKTNKVVVRVRLICKKITWQ